MVHRDPIRWFNHKLGDFEWREVRDSDERALELLDGSPYSPICARIYREWRELGGLHRGGAHEGGRGGQGPERGRVAAGR
jgi:hypothetical protein